MIRGKIPFKCDQCGAVFIALDIEYNATALSQPQECPKCHSLHTMPSSIFNWLQSWLYKKIWKSSDQK